MFGRLTIGAVIAATFAVAAHATVVVPSRNVRDAEMPALRAPLSSWSLGPTGVSNGTFPLAVNVPCTVIACLLEAGHYPFDPFYGKNLQRINKADFAVPWTYTTTFTTPADWAAQFAAGGRVVLELQGINYRADLRVNGQLIASKQVFYGALNRFEIDVGAAMNLAADGATTFNITLWRMQDDPGNWRNNGTDLGVSFDDWNPHPADLSMGVYRPAHLRMLPAAPAVTGPAFNPGLVTFDGFVANTKLLLDGESNTGAETVSAYLNFSVAATYWGTIPVGASAVTGIVTLDVSSLIPGLSPLSCALTFTASNSTDYPIGTTQRAVWSWVDTAGLVLPSPPLWWPWQFSNSRPFFNATVTATTEAQAAGGAVFNTRFALREITKRLTKGGALQFVVNRRPMAIAAGGYPPDMFQRVDVGRMNHDFDMMIDMGLNAVRLEGMMLYDQFFDAADERGFFVMPGFGCCDGWQHWAGWPEENYRVAAESTRKQARRLGSHPSVITFLLSSDQLPPTMVEAMYNRVFAEEAWPNTLISSASQQWSYVSGQSGVKMVGPYSWVPPTYWLDDGRGNFVNGTQMNYGGAWGFLTEGGPGESPMTYASWRRTVPEAHLWDNTTKSMDSWWSWHMGCPFGHFRNLTYYTPPLNARYGESTNSRTYLYRAQAANLEGIRSMFESYSRNRHVNATGVVQWQVKMAWPSHLWNLYDWYFVSGGGFYGAKRALERLHAMMSYDDGTVWVVGSRYNGATVRPIHVNATVMTAEATSRVVWSAAGTIEGGLSSDGAEPVSGVQVPSAEHIAALIGGDAAVGRTYFVRVSWYVEGAEEATQTNWYWQSTHPDVIGPWAASNGFRTPCYRWADYAELNQLPATNLERSVSYSAATPTTTTANVTLINPGEAVAFLVQVRFVLANSTVAPVDAADIAPVYCNDNFFSIAPRSTVTVVCTLPVGAATAVTLDVQTYNDVVAQA